MGKASGQRDNQMRPDTEGTSGTLPVYESSSGLQSSLMRRLGELGLLDDPKFTAEVLSSYLRDGLKAIEDLEAAIRAQDIEACELLSHRMKGASLNLGAEKLGGIALALETLARDGDLSDAVPLIAQLREEFQNVRACLLRLPGISKAA